MPSLRSPARLGALLRIVVSSTVLVIVDAGATRGDDAPAPDFERHVRPILTARCGKCHGDDQRKGGLALTTADGLARGGDSGPVVTPRKPDESSLYEHVRSGEMPPAGQPRVTPEELATLRRWIEAGADAPRSRTAPPIDDVQVLPILRLRCVPCHGGRRREADLDLRSVDSLLRGGKSGPAVVAGRPDESPLVRRIRAEEMPPRRQLVSVSVKPTEPAELQKLEAWIAAGLPRSAVPPDVATTEPDRVVTDADRDFWSFRSPRPVSATSYVPTTDAGRREANGPVDGLLLAKLSEVGLSFAPQADRATLARRLYFDLVGLPPPPDAVAEFAADETPDAVERLAERLLASPRHGERWARHWLDVAGYADSEGSQNEDRVRPNMWRYRDYVIRALNADKPYDRFLLEQIAGDELADYRGAAEITDELYDNLAATGFLRTAPDRTFANITNFVPDRLEVIADEMQILGSAVLGLTLHCARCHGHKFDPLPQRDYYRLAAALKDALDEHDWLGPEARQLSFVTTAERKAWERREADVTARVAPLKQELAAATDEARKTQLQAEIQRIEGERRPEPTIRALWSRGDPSPTYVLRRGNYLTPGAEVGPGVPSMLTDGRTPFTVEPPWPGAPTTGRRLALARWLVRPDHPLTSRVLVNRVWKHHFGAGIVATLGNFGKTGAAPTHPELLDWLAGDFVRGGWSLKSLHRVLVTSRAYRQTSRETDERRAADPDNRRLSRMPLRRLEAESVRDALLAVADRLDAAAFGPPAGVQERGDGLITTPLAHGGGRRSVYVLHRRTKLPTLLENFDSPQMGPNCVERNESNVAPQALHLLNNAAVAQLAGAFAKRVAAEAGNDPAARVRRAFLRATGREPGEDEFRESLAALERFAEAWRADLPSDPNSAQHAADAALRTYCHALFNSAAFLYVD